MRYEFTCNGSDKLILTPQNSKEEILLADVFAGEIEIVKELSGKSYTIIAKKDKV